MNTFQKIPVLVTALPLLLISFITGCENQEADRILLNGTWKLSINPQSGFENDTLNTEGWRNIQIPGECQMQGFAIKHDVPFVLKKEVDIPGHFRNREIFLCFDGIYSYARVWVDGTYVRDHTGGFTPWECDITAHVKAGKKVRITVECTDRKNDQSYAGGYAKHQIGGILRDVCLKALSPDRINTCHVETLLDDLYADAVLAIDLKIQLANNADLSVVLLDPKGRRLKLPEMTC
jgi:beta-galactosidase/beta-glucuronidase